MSQGPDKHSEIIQTREFSNSGKPLISATQETEILGIVVGRHLSQKQFLISTGG
jgi:hypothetical protein